MAKKQTVFQVETLDRITGETKTFTVSGEPSTQAEAERLVFFNNAVHNSLHPGSDVVPQDPGKFIGAMRKWAEANPGDAQILARGLIRLQDHTSPESKQVLDLLRSIGDGGEE